MMEADENKETKREEECRVRKERSPTGIYFADLDHATEGPSHTESTVKQQQHTDSNERQRKCCYPSTLSYNKKPRINK
jgi:hypothetical protein